MPPEVPDTLLPQKPTMDSLSASLPSLLMNFRNFESAPFLPQYSSPDASSSATASESQLMTYPPQSRDQAYTLPLITPPSDSRMPLSLEHQPKPTPVDPLPPTTPIINLTLQHVIHRLTSPVPDPPLLRADGARGGLDGEDDELAVLNLPFPKDREYDTHACAVISTTERAGDEGAEWVRGWAETISR